LDWIQEGWNSEVDGYSMFELYSKLKGVKQILKAKNKEFFNGLGQRVVLARKALAMAQEVFIASHGSLNYYLKEKECLHEFISISLAKENFLKQKSINQWLNLGDGNNKFFHTKVKVGNSFNMIKSLKDEEGNVVDDMKGIKN